MSEMLMTEANQTNEGSEQQQSVDTATSEQTTESQQQAEVDSVRAELTTNTCSAGAATCPGEEESSI